MKIIPQNVKKVLVDYISKRCPHAEAGWNNANQDEDTITGDFLGNLRTGDWQIGDNVKFKFSYNKFRGRGNEALEKKSGADGIITIELHDLNGGIKYKSFVFQAKKVGNYSGKDQKNLMDQLFPKANAIFRYSSKGYMIEGHTEQMSICNFICEVFLNCDIGLEGLHYDEKRNKLSTGNLFFKQAKYFNELKIEVKV